MDWAGERRGRAFADYDELWRWSVDELEDFWASIWEFCGVRASKPYRARAGLPRDARHALVRGRGAELRGEPCWRAARGRADEVAVLHCSELRLTDQLARSPGAS